MTVIITGGAGFIGSHVAELSAAQNHRVIVVDNLSNGKRENVPKDVELVELDIRDRAALIELFERERPQTVFHLAAQASVSVSVREPELDLEVNVGGTQNVCEAARLVGAKVCFASTGGALYGVDAVRPTDEQAATEPLSPYGASKLAAESYVGTWGRLYGIPNQILRLANVYGPRQNSEGEAGVVAIFATHLLAGEPPTVFGDGEQTRDYVYVKDVATAFLLAAEQEAPGTYNVGTGTETTVNELLAHLQQAAGTALDARYLPARPGELPASSLSAERAERVLGWKQSLTVGDGLAETFAWYRGSRAG